MKIAINNHRKIFAIQEEFSELFPGLKIAFHAKPNTNGGAPSEKLVTQSSRTLKECRAIHTEGNIEVMPTMTISNLKENLRDIFGLSVEIFGKSGTGPGEKHEGDQLTLEESSNMYAV